VTKRDRVGGSVGGSKRPLLAWRIYAMAPILVFHV